LFPSATDVLVASGRVSKSENAALGSEAEAMEASKEEASEAFEASDFGKATVEDEAE
jgi:uncharacterized protein YciI